MQHSPSVRSGDNLNCPRFAIIRSLKVLCAFYQRLIQIVARANGELTFNLGFAKGGRRRQSDLPRYQRRLRQTIISYA